MRAGLLLSAQLPGDGDPRAALGEWLEQVRLARALGFDAVLAPQHYLAEPYRMLQPLPLLGRLTAEAEGMRLGTGVLLLTLLNPVEVAEAAATLDVISGGRLVLGVGLGYRREEREAFAAPERRAAAFRDKLDVVRRLLEGEVVTTSGPGYRLHGARLALRPLQRPRPPIWLAANADAGVRRAARLGDAWLVNPHGSLGELERQVGLYRRERGGPPGEVPVVREAVVAPTDEEAEALARAHLAPKYRTYLGWGQDQAVPSADTLRREWEALRAGRFLIGARRVHETRVSHRESCRKA